MSGQSSTCETVVVGAGPYGLSIAAHLRHAGIAAHVLGEPMTFWRNNMPRGMLMRSPWRATHFSDPDGAWSLEAYAATHGVDKKQRLPLETFIAYGEWFQRHAVADVDHRTVRQIDAARDGFRLTLDDGEMLNAERVIIATGLRNQEYRPLPFKDVPATLASHTSVHPDLSVFRGKRVAVIGRGQSACEFGSAARREWRRSGDHQPWRHPLARRFRQRGRTESIRPPATRGDGVTVRSRTISAELAGRSSRRCSPHAGRAA